MLLCGYIFLSIVIQRLLRIVHIFIILVSMLKEIVCSEFLILVTRKVRLYTIKTGSRSTLYLYNNAAVKSQSA